MIEKTPTYEPKKTEDGFCLEDYTYESGSEDYWYDGYKGESICKGAHYVCEGTKDLTQSQKTFACAENYEYYDSGSYSSDINKYLYCCKKIPGPKTCPDGFYFNDGPINKEYKVDGYGEYFCDGTDYACEGSHKQNLENTCAKGYGLYESGDYNENNFDEYAYCCKFDYESLLDQ